MEQESMTMHIHHTNTDPMILKQLWNDMTDAEKLSCRSQFGPLDDLVSLQVNWNFVKAMVWFWDSNRRCFVINNSDYCPTIEEYNALMNSAITKSSTAYTPSAEEKPPRQLARLMGRQFATVSPYMQQDSNIRIEKLIALRDELIAKDGAADYRIRTFVLAVYGLIIFPKAPSTIDCEIYYLVFSMFHRQVNPIPSILAETVATLNKMTRTKKGGFNCCAPLLQVWAYYHFMESFVHNPYLQIGKPVHEVREAKKEERTIEQWKEYLRTLTQARWYGQFMVGHRPFKILTKCQPYDWVPLFGPWTCVSYTAASVLRQFRYKQDYLKCEGLSDVEFGIWEKENNVRKLHKDANAMKKSWERPDYRPIEANEGMANWQEPTPLYSKMRDQQEIAILANKQSRVAKRKIDLEQMIEELLQEKEQATRREFEDKIRILEEGRQAADASQIAYAQLRESYEKQLLAEKQRVSILTTERDHLNQMNRIHRFDKKELEKERDQRDEELRKWELMYTEAEAEKAKALEGKHKTEDNIRRFRKELSKKNNEVAYYKREYSHLQSANRQALEKEKGKYKELALENERLHKDNVYLAHMYQKKPKSQQEYEIQIDKMERKLELYETEHYYLNRELDTAKRESFRLLDTVTEVDGMMRGMEKAIHPFANQEIAADLKRNQRIYRKVLE
jgi:hypothetical protein